MSEAQRHEWPQLHFAEWAETCATLHLWTQVVGKVRLAKTPWLNHSWHVPLYVTSCGLTTSAMPDGERSVQIDFDFLAHQVVVATSDGRQATVPLAPQSVADFKARLMAALTSVGVAVAIRDLPCEIADAVPFSQDHVHSSYDAIYAQRFWQVLVQVDRVFKHFRTGFMGKNSPIHFFWGSFDLAVTRFSGRRAPLHPGKAPGLAAIVMQEAYSHELSSAGFWPGGSGVDASFYAYAYPEPAGFRNAAVMPAGAHYDPTFGEYLLPYESVRTASDPDGTLLAFLETTYAAAADAGHWDRAALECSLGRAGVCRDPRQ